MPGSIGEVHAVGLIPDILKCDEEYSLWVHVEYPVEDCKLADYEAAYNRANGIGRAKLPPIKCSPNCGPRVDIEIARRWYCSAKTLYADVKFLTVCPSKAKKQEWDRVKKKRDLGPPKRAELKRSKPEPGDSEFDDALVLIKTDAGQGIFPCPWGPVTYSFTYVRSFNCSEYDMKTGNPGMNAAAEKWAEFLAKLSFICMGRCALNVTTAVVGGSCYADRVTIPVRVEVSCA